MKDIVIYPSKIKMVFLAIGAIIFVCFGAAFAIWGDELKISPLKLFLDTYLAIPFFSFCLIYYLYRLFAPKPALIINNRGIYDNSSAIPGGLIGWDEISSIFVYSYKGQKFLGIVPFDPEAYLKRQMFLKRYIMKINMRMLRAARLEPAPINIPQNTLPIKVEALLMQISEFSKLVRN